ncbi:MAG: MerR family transcriptional regulator [Candidatus Poribacteria bacterium]
MKKSRLLVSDVAEITGLHPATVRKLADEGKIKSQRDWNDWRVFAPEEVERLKRLAGTHNQKPATADTVRVGMNA